MNFGGFFDFDAKSARLAEVNRLVEDPELWNDPKRAQEIGREKKSLESVVGALSQLTQQIGESVELLDMARDENDDATLIAVESDAAAIERQVADLEFRRMFSNPADPANCFLDIQAGAGGTEACDWASILLRQYLRYSERKGFKADLLEESEGDVAG
ncbi:MAG: peptide chain release factor 2, partial [Pseudomonadota bacterium]